MASEDRVPDRDVHAFDRRAKAYDEGRHGQLHHDISDRVVDLVLAVHPPPRRILDVGCGTGYVIKSLLDRVPDIEQIVGIDPATTMIEVAQSSVRDPRARFDSGVAEHLPYEDGAFDLIVSTTSFDHWTDQGSGLRECARVLALGGHIVLADQFSLLLYPKLLFGRRGKARTRKRATHQLTAAGFHDLQGDRLYAVIIGAVAATKRIPPNT